MKLSTPVIIDRIEPGICLEDRIMVLGSCFADEMGSRLKAAGFSVMVNPFGTLYNPESIAEAVERLESAAPFTEADCVEMGAGAARICSFSHHTSFSRPSAEEFLAVANDALARAAEFWRGCNRVIVTLGTAMVWRRGGRTVANCLKRPAREFTHEMLDNAAVLAALRRIVSACPDAGGRCVSDDTPAQGMTCAPKSFLFTVSPIRHLSLGAHNNTLSKARLQLSLDEFLRTGESARCAYFPAYEILLDELRDYRFYAEDMCHPSSTAAGVIWEKFVEAVVPAADHERMKENERQYRRSLHRPLL